MPDASPVIPWPFAYPKVGWGQRRHGPAGYRDYTSYKDWLRDEYDFRCAYCLTRERWERDPRSNFSVEHIVPRSADDALECHYPNLVLACTRCNSFRGATPLPFDVTRDSIREHCRLDGDGTYKARSLEGGVLIDLLCLNDATLIDSRRRVLCAYARVLGYLEGATGLEFDYFRYPLDLPDLKRYCPPENSKPEGLDNSAYERNFRGELPEFY